MRNVKVKSTKDLIEVYINGELILHVIDFAKIDTVPRSKHDKNKFVVLTYNKPVKEVIKRDDESFWIQV